MNPLKVSLMILLMVVVGIIADVALAYVVVWAAIQILKGLR